MTRDASAGLPSARREIAFRILGFAAIFLLLVGILVPVAALAFSVRVDGKSMEPTLHTGDRLVLDFLHHNEINRFDLVDATYGEGNAIRIVKRVVGMPGDQVAVSPVTGDTPHVWLRKAGSKTVYEVHNPTWTGQIGPKASPCCAKDGKSSEKRAWVTVPADHYWLLGDNWGGSEDSRFFGFVSLDDIGGSLNLRILPLGKFGTIPNPASLHKAAQQ